MLSGSSGMLGKCFAFDSALMIFPGQRKMGVSSVTGMILAQTVSRL